MSVNTKVTDTAANIANIIQDVYRLDESRREPTPIDRLVVEYGDTASGLGIRVTIEPNGVVSQVDPPEGIERNSVRETLKRGGIPLSR